MGWYGLCGVHWGVKPGDEAVAGGDGGSTWVWERPQEAVAGTVVCKTPAQQGVPRVSQHPSPMGPPENLRIVRFLVDRTIPRQGRGGPSRIKRGSHGIACVPRATQWTRKPRAPTTKTLVCTTQVDHQYTRFSYVIWQHFICADQPQTPTRYQLVKETMKHVSINCTARGKNHKEVTTLIYLQLPSAECGVVWVFVGQCDWRGDWVGDFRSWLMICKWRVHRWYRCARVLGCTGNADFCGRVLLGCGNVGWCMSLGSITGSFGFGMGAFGRGWVTTSDLCERAHIRH